MMFEQAVASLLNVQGFRVWGVRVLGKRFFRLGPKYLHRNPIEPTISCSWVC